MNIITGITNFKEKGKGKKEKGKFFNILSVSMMAFAFLFSACASKQQAPVDETIVRSDVKVSVPIIGNAESILSFKAVTRYMQSNDIRSQITGIVTQINCSVADDIHPNQALFIIQPQEAAALKKMKFNNQILTGLSDTVFAHLNGQISKLDVQVGDFVQIGDILATCIRSNSIRIIAYIPIEQVPEIEKIKDCSVVLPDGSTVVGKILSKLPSAETKDQTQSYIIETRKLITFSENINLTVNFTGNQIHDALFVPESAVLGNEEQTSFWVMKLLNDSICVKVQVEKGIEKDSMIQILGSGLTSTDRVVFEGGYGLPDSAKIQVANTMNEVKKPAANMKSTGSRH
jgi:multidrug efflux pump subunit AcrA (membrane-fusion protein)